MYVKGRFVVESIRVIADNELYRHTRDSHLDFEKAFDSIEWTSSKNALNLSTLDQISDN